MKLTVPTALTLFRIVLIPVFVIAFYWTTPMGPKVAALVFALASITDWFDGFLARILRQESAFGAFLDPVADKVLLAAAFIMLMKMPQLHIPGWCVVAILAREFLVTGADILSIDSAGETTPDLYFVVRRGGKEIFRSEVFAEVDFQEKDPVTGRAKGLTKAFGPFRVATQ